MTEQIEHIGYKKCQDGRIVILEILGDNNENRAGIVDKNYAKFRCSKARVLEIYDMNDRSNIFISAFGILDDSFEYRVDTIIEPKNGFDPNPENVCTSGIHYFLTEESAYFWIYSPANGVCRTWHDDGQIIMECTYKDGKLDGLYKSYHNNGQIMVECTYKDGKCDGPYKLHYDNGQIENECTYKDGELDGPYKTYHYNGLICYECNYKESRKYGLCRSYYYNGRIRYQYIYKDGVIVG